MAEKSVQKKERQYNLLVVVKGKERYFFKYGRNQIRTLFNTLVEFGGNNACNLTLLDALFLIKKLKEKQRNAV